MSFLTFLLGLIVGALYSPVIKPLLLKLWAKFQKFLNTPRE